MTHLNIEFKALGNNIKILEEKLLSLNPKFIGEDHQKDTYYNVQEGRLKLREGNIENALIWYQREDIGGAKQSDILLYKHAPDDALKKILLKLHGIKIVVDKIRRIYFVDNVKFHFDTVEGLGTFIEVEAIDSTSEIGIEKLKEQCDFYITFFEIKADDFVKISYSDMMLNILIKMQNLTIV
ncbi:MAG: class IV adenylate cyclase [Ferruginibacter sp.]